MQLESGHLQELIMDQKLKQPPSFGPYTFINKQCEHIKPCSLKTLLPELQCFVLLVLLPYFCTTRTIMTPELSYFLYWVSFQVQFETKDSPSI